MEKYQTYVYRTNKNPIRTSKETVLGSQMRMKLCEVLYIYITKEYITVHITKECLCNS